MTNASLAMFATTLSVTLGLSNPGLAQDASNARPQPTATCREGANSMEFTFDGKGHAKLTLLEGSEIKAFADMKETDWSVRYVAEGGAPSFRISNRLGAVLTMLLPPPSGRTVGQLALSTPAGGKIDLICDVTGASG